MPPTTTIGVECVVDDLPITWAMTQTKLTSLIDMAYEGQHCVQICVEVRECFKLGEV